jgi:hypothetical protein
MKHWVRTPLEAQIEAEHFRREAEADRDTALRSVTELREQLKMKDEEIAGMGELVRRAQSRLKEHIDDADDADLLDLTRAVFGLRPREARGGEASSSSGDGTSTDAVSNPPAPG